MVKRSLSLFVSVFLICLFAMSGMAGKGKREREDLSPQIEQLEDRLKGKDAADQESILLDVSAEDVKNFVDAMAAEQELLDKHLEVYNSLRKRVLVKTSDGQVRHYRIDILNKFDIFNVIPDATKSVSLDKNEPILLGTKVPTAENFMTLYNLSIG